MTKRFLKLELYRLWGNPSHLDYVAASLRERYGSVRLYILAAEGNAGNFTYDGIELGGERLAHEAEETLHALAGGGHKITKLSVVGYSLGGLVARYALGLLYARGWLERLEPVNFTTFASPHVGVRTPLKGIQNHMWNVLGARTVSMSGRQLFMIDSFRETGKPLLCILADPESIFIKALAQFKNRCLYANVANDRSTVFYTTGITTFDLFPDVENTNFNYARGYEPVVIDSEMYTLPSEGKESMPLHHSHTWGKTRRTVANFPFLVFLLFITPVGSIFFLLNAVVQTLRSRQRIRLHEQGKSGVLLGSYRSFPLLVQDVQSAVEDVFENVNSSQDPNYLSPIDEPDSFETSQASKEEDQGFPQSSHLENIHPTLALTPAQFAIVDTLNTVGFRRHPVYIHNHRHSHAAIIVRVPKKGFEEGKIVIKHWLDNEFEV